MAISGRRRQYTHVTAQPDPPDVFATLDDEYAREILVATKNERLSARELSEACDMSQPTVSRRVNRLVEQGFLREHTHVDPSGHHYREYEARLERIEVLLESEGFDVHVDVQPDPADRLTSIFEEMRGD